MIHFTKNTGQFHSKVAFVAKVPDEMKNNYRGSGLAELILDGQQIVGFEYIKNADCEESDLLDFEQSGRPAAMVSCFELVIPHGTAAAALLNLTGDHA